MIIHKLFTELGEDGRHVQVHGRGFNQAGVEGCWSGVHLGPLGVFLKNHGKVYELFVVTSNL